MKIIWYAGPSSDIAKVKEGHQVVLHADDVVCRVLSHRVDKIDLIGYPSREKNPASHKYISFAERQYCFYPCFVYESVHENDTNGILDIYKQFCERSENEAITAFLDCHEATKRQEAPAVNLDLLAKSGCFNLTVSHCGKRIGSVKGQFTFKACDGGRCPHRVVVFDRKKMIDEVNTLMVSYGNPPGRAIAKRIVDNLLSAFAWQTAAQGVEFDHTLFDGE